MKKLLVISFMLFGFSGVGHAQQTGPALEQLAGTAFAVAVFGSAALVVNPLPGLVSGDITPEEYLNISQFTAEAAAALLARDVQNLQSAVESDLAGAELPGLEGL